MSTQGCAATPGSFVVSRLGAMLQLRALAIGCIEARFKRKRLTSVPTFSYTMSSKCLLRFSKSVDEIASLRNSST